MDLLFQRMPKLARFMMLGIMCMFIAPFGMLIAKWATLISFVETNSFVLILLLAFGSGATFMFWAKWLGKLTGIAGEPEDVELTVHKSEWAALYLMAGLIIAVCVLLPVISSCIVEPYIASMFGVPAQGVGQDNLWIASVLVAFVAIVLFGGLRHSRQKKVDVYLSGVGTDFATRTYVNSMGGQTQATARNLYLDPLFGEGRLKVAGEVICTVLIVIAFIASGVLF
jgi:ech hydrogenase subunit A